MSKPAKQTLTERRAEELKLTIALTARDLFVTDGDTSATVERICEIVGISPRTFHRHFPVKEDVAIPLFRRFGSTTTEVFETAGPQDDPVETLVRAFTTEIRRRHFEEFDRKFMSLVVKTPPFRLRWMEWCEHMEQPVTEFLSTRFDLDDDPFLRELPARLIVHTSVHAYIQWVDTGDLTELESRQREGMRMIVGGLREKRRQPTISGQ
ncbi:TetR/AcrR family transcriptional regulator [Nocardia sp. NPDC052278]|uniref:TetR/AcrR family transcriptional regulator n=1 Tax=unclassified Nocardia TaxID=2637762 RepID=UPI0036A37BD2